MAESRLSDELPYERGARKAVELRLALGIGDEPIVDLWRLVGDLGVNLAFHDFGASGGDGLYKWTGAVALIIANGASSSRLRQRFTVAHELGHHELHRHGAAPLLIADKDIFGRREPVEQEANAFAGHLLMPDPAITRTLTEWQPVEITPELVARLMQRFGVSYEVAVFRLHNASVINAGRRDALIEAKRQTGVRTICDAIRFNEFFEYPLPATALPTAYETDVLQAYSARAIDEKRLAELLRVGAAEARAFARTACAEQAEEELSDEEFEALLGG